MKKNIVFVLVLLMTILFLMSPIVLRIPFVKESVSWCLSVLGKNEYKSSYIEAVGGLIGTAAAITGTLFLQGMIDQKTDKENKVKEENDIRYRIIVVYYDLKLAFEELSKIYRLLVVSAFLVEENKIQTFYDSATKIELYIDDNWIRNVASLHGVLGENILEKIFRVYGDISSVRNGLRTGDRGEYQTARIISLMNQFFIEIDGQKTKLNNEYEELLKTLREKGNIEE